MDVLSPLLTPQSLEIHGKAGRAHSSVPSGNESEGLCMASFLAHRQCAQVGGADGVYD